MSKFAVMGSLLVVCLATWAALADPDTRVYENRLTPIANPKPLLADYPEFVEPIREKGRLEAPPLIDDLGADLDVRAWRFSYNARGIIEIPNRLKASQTAIIVVHPWGIDDGQGWRTPEPAGVAFGCTPEKNRLCLDHARRVVNPFLKSHRGKVGLIVYSLPGDEDPIRKKIYRSIRSRPTASDRARGAVELKAKLNSFAYKGSAIPSTVQLKGTAPATAEYFQQFPSLDAGDKFNNQGFWKLPIPVVKDIEVDPDDVVIYDPEGYEPLRKFLQSQGIRHVLLAGYHADMCVCKTTAGYENLSRDFNLFLVGDATLATFPAVETPRFATNATIARASLTQLITQVSWIRPMKETIGRANR